MSYQLLKTRQRQERAGYHSNLAIRIHRALSWLNRAEQIDDDDSKFIFLWIAFNAAYANDTDIKRFTETQTFRNFLTRLNDLDSNNYLYELVWQEFPGSIRVLLDNRYIFKDFWDHQAGKLSEEDWIKHFSTAKSVANKALGNKNTVQVLSIIFSRLYTLRNQMIHGGATWNSSVNRDQLRDCVQILGKLVPFIIEIMMDNADVLWGEPCYQVVDDAFNLAAG